MLQCWRRTGHLPSFFFFLTAQESPPKAIQGKKMLTLGGQPGWRAGRRWNWLMHNLEAPWILRATTLLHLLYFSVNSGIKTLFLILNTCECSLNQFSTWLFVSLFVHWEAQQIFMGLSRLQIENKGPIAHFQVRYDRWIKEVKTHFVQP